MLPIEVIGERGFRQAVFVDVPNADDVDRLWLQAHRPGYTYGDGAASSRGESRRGRPKASVRVNGGPWIDIDNRTVECAFPESEYECIGGAYATVRFTLEVDNVQSGRNRIQFRFNGTDGLTSGWRVLAFNFLRSDSSAVIPASAFVEDDPDDWRPPRMSGVDAGKELWYEADLVDYPGGPSIRASCASCHAQDGRDLQFFSYSNRSIIERSKFHGLSQRDAERIASYIRSLDVPRAGRPWNPPYQPGPGLDDRPAEEWAAGAGLEWVLDRDADMLDHLFPRGINRPVQMAKEVGTDQTLNLREIPIALQLPDWNEWLPRVHPVDSRWRQGFEDSDVLHAYTTEIPTLLEGGVAAAVESGKIEREFKFWYDDLREFEGDHNIKQQAKNRTGDEAFADEALGVKQWFAVKSWEIMTGYAGLEEAAPELYPEFGEPRSWFSQSRTLFDLAPHIIGTDQSGTYPHGSPLQNTYFSTAWYELQSIMNAGNRDISSVGPVDWRYHFGHIGGLGKHTGQRHPLRTYKAYVKVMQQSDMPDVGVSEVPGFWGQFVSPSRLLGDAAHNTEKDPWLGMPNSIRGPITEAALRAHYDKLRRHSTSEWPRGDGQDYMPPSSYRPRLSNKIGDSVYADDYYRGLTLFEEMGVHPAVLTHLAQWGEEMWPKGDWFGILDAPDFSGLDGTAADVGAGEDVQTALGLPAPNPACGEATGSYTLAEAGPVQFEVFDTMGRLVGVLDEGERVAGRHEVPLRFRGLADGVYVLRLRAGTFVDSRMVTLACGGGFGR